MSNNIKWYRSPLAKQDLSALTSRNDFKATLQAVLFLLLYLGFLAWALFLQIEQSWLFMVIVCLFFSIFVDFFGIEAASHELSHRTAFKSKRVNSFFYHLFCFLTWNNPYHFKESHNRHHQFTYFHLFDREQISRPIPFTKWDILSWFTFDYKKFIRYARMILSYAKGSMKNDLFFWHQLVDNEDPKSRQMIHWARFLLIGHIGLMLLFALFGAWVLIYMVSFSYFFLTFLSHGTGISQHTGLRGDVPDWRRNSFTIDMNPILRFLYWNMNYHTEHHMYAGVPFYNLPKLRKKLISDLQKPMPGLLSTLMCILETSRKQREEPDYRYEPEFPPTAREV